MIGIVDRNRLFEYHDVSELSYSMNAFADAYRVNTILITDRSGNLKACFRFDGFDFTPVLEQETDYRLLGCDSSKEYDVFTKNMKIKIENNPKIKMNYPFVFIEQRIPKIVDL